MRDDQDAVEQRAEELAKACSDILSGEDYGTVGIALAGLVGHLLSKLPREERPKALKFWVAMLLSDIAGRDKEPPQ